MPSSQIRKLRFRESPRPGRKPAGPAPRQAGSRGRAPKRQLVIITLTTGFESLASLGFTFLFCDACFVILGHDELLVLGPLLTVSTVAQGQTWSRARHPKATAASTPTLLAPLWSASRESELEEARRRALTLLPAPSGHEKLLQKPQPAHVPRLLSQHRKVEQVNA